MISELDARKIGYKDDLSNKELLGLLEPARAKEKADDAEAKADRENFLKTGAEARAKAACEEKAEEPLNIDYSGIRCGLSTIQDLHRRVCIIEHKLGIKN